MNGPVERVLAALRSGGYSPRKSGAGWSCRCPAHDDRKPSLSIGTGDDGRALLTCHAGCTAKAICTAVGLREADLFVTNARPRNGNGTATKPQQSACRKPSVDNAERQTFRTAEDALAALRRRHGPPSQSWTYHDATGEPVGLVVRWGTPDRKNILPVSRKPDGSRWCVEGMPTPRPLYALPDLLATPAGVRVYVCEGEKAADAARAVGLTATTSAHGSNAADTADWSPLAGRDVVILPDRDDNGEHYAADVARLARNAGARSVRVVRLAALWNGLPAGGDMADLVEHRGNDAESIRAEIEALADATKLETNDRGFAPLSALDLIRQYPELRPVVIDGLLREGETMNVVTSPKVGKSWLIHWLVVALVAGLDWMGRRTLRGRVLLIDAELHPETVAWRLRHVQNDLQVADVDMRQLDTWLVRGRRLTIEAIAEMVQGRPPGEYRLIVFDALYRFLPTDGKENENETMTRVYNTLDLIAERSGASIIVVHHATKGSQADKAVTDVGAGAGAQSRAADSHLILRPHDVDGAVVVDAAVRSFRPIDPFVIRNLSPGWALAPDLDPAQIRTTRRPRKPAEVGQPKAEPIRSWTPDDFATDIVGRERSIKDEVIARAVERGLGKVQAGELLRRAEAAGKVFRHQDGPCAPHRFSIDPPAGASNAELGGAVRASTAPDAHASGGVGGTHETPLPPSDPPEPQSQDNEWGDL